MEGRPISDSPDGITCCSICYISAENVDVYYWPEPNANTECLDIVGTDINPPLFGARTDSRGTYWGCTTVGHLSISSFMTTATLTSIGPVSFKKFLVNPWSTQNCVVEVGDSQFSGLPSIAAHGTFAQINPRGHSLIVPSNKT